MSDFIDLHRVSPTTFSALQAIADRFAWADVHHFMLPETMAWMTFRLAELPDNEKDFPKGKWATIQHLQALLSEEACRDVAVSPSNRRGS